MKASEIAACVFYGFAAVQLILISVGVSRIIELLEAMQ